VTSRIKKICRTSKIIFKPLITNYGIVTSVEGWLLIKIRFADKFTKQFY